MSVEHLTVLMKCFELPVAQALVLFGMTARWLADMLFNYFSDDMMMLSR